MKTITISASDVAACIGKNPYKSSDEIITKLLSKYCKEKNVKTEEQQVEELLQDHAIAQSILHDINVTAGVLSPQTVRDHIKKQLTSLEHTFTFDEKKQIEKYMYSKANTIHGIKSEDHTADCVGDHLERDNTFYTYFLCTIQDYSFQIVGRIDRIEKESDGSKTIIEIKNRVRGLFGKIKEYEEIQVQTYLQLVNLQKARLIEQDKGGTINSYNIERDNEWWQEIKTNLYLFCNTFYEKTIS
jgi:hypothetical protein